jgi:hypothetical protein
LGRKRLCPQARAEVDAWLHRHGKVALFDLCGTFDDLTGGILDLHAANAALYASRDCPEGEECRGNLCARP